MKKGDILIYGAGDPENAIECVFESYEITEKGDVIISAKCNGGMIIAPWEMFKQPKRSTPERPPWDGLPVLTMADQKGKNIMEKIVNWLISCGYSEREAVKEANQMIERNRWDGAEKCSREFAIAMLLEDLEIC